MLTFSDVHCPLPLPLKNVLLLGLPVALNENCNVPVLVIGFTETVAPLMKVVSPTSTCSTVPPPAELFIVKVVPTNAVVMFVPPVISIALPEATEVGPPVSPSIVHVYVHGIVDNVLRDPSPKTTWLDAPCQGRVNVLLDVFIGEGPRAVSLLVVIIS